MESIIAIGLLLSIMLTSSGCSNKPITTPTTAATSSSSSVISSTVSSTKENAKKYIADVKKRMQDTQKPEYFQSKEWKAFVDSFWQGYNEAQQTAKNPDLITSSEITY